MATLINNEEPKGRGKSFFSLTEDQKNNFMVQKTEKMIRKEKDKQAIILRRSECMGKKVKEANEKLKFLKKKEPEKHGQQETPSTEQTK